MTHIKKQLFIFTTISILFLGNIFANEKESVILDNREFIEEEIILAYNPSCEAMCTATYIQKSSLCSNLNSDKNREQCYQDAKDWEDKCLMQCK